MSTIILCLALPVWADTITFTLLPSNGNVSGPPGSLVGWGYSLTNTDLFNWFVSGNLNSDWLLNGTPAVLFEFPILAPGEAIKKDTLSVPAERFNEVL